MERLLDLGIGGNTIVIKNADALDDEERELIQMLVAWERRKLKIKAMVCGKPETVNGRTASSTASCAKIINFQQQP